MSSAIKNSILIIGFVILLPISIVIALEAGSLSENEKMLEEAYKEQLDAIIFSINQYSGDVFEFYLKQIDFTWRQSDNTTAIDSTFIQQNLAIGAVIIKKDEQLVNYQLDASMVVTEMRADSIFRSNTAVIERLMRYKETGYIKPEVVGQLLLNEKLANVNLIILGQNTPCLVFIDPILFIEDLLAPKIQQISGHDLQITVEYAPSNTIIYGSPIDKSRIAQTGDLTLIDNFNISVTLLDQDVQDILKGRTQKNVLMLIAVVVLVCIGVFFLVKNMRNELLLSRAKSDFVANVSHEIRTPLALISMFIETLVMKRVSTEEKKEEYYHIIFKETNRLNNIVNKILTFSQIDAQQKQYQFKKINLNDIIQETIDSYSYHLKEKGFTYEVQLSDPAQIKGDQEAIVEVLVNLIDNAIKYSRDIKQLCIRTHGTQEGVSVEIEDQGLGISAKDQQQIFKKFFRVSTGDVHTTKGTGLGLSLVHEIMKAHRGSVKLKSELGVGSTFILIFPIDHE